eukprot:CAMPEP_0181325388 /NCGR_PEP_ID=MMETSP1101-20121128/20894_1 /TAXON_ID=46948 /ORGANISM="Rhodomonas abbreviata, Strain Caron Lab Isolate" /LENGTH=225 /DNA_ID=CAMNT_0023433683 /DNA_START=11 /DNA_END=688 /DNA_ORIENTATION=+
MARLQNNDDTRQLFENVIQNTLTDVAKFAAKNGHNDSVAELDGISREIAGEIARLEAAQKKINEAQFEDRQAVANKLLEPMFANAEAEKGYKTCQSYKEFSSMIKANGVGAGRGDDDDDEDDEDVVVASQSLQMVDPLTRSALQEEAGHYPLALPCGHVYNYSTVFNKKQDGTWSLTDCVVGACSRKLGDRKALKEDAKTKHAIQRQKHHVGESSTQQSIDIDDL